MGSNKELVERLLEAINQRDMDALDGIVAEDFKRHSHATPGLKVESRQDFKDFLKLDGATFPDARQEVLMLVAEGSLVAARVRLTGTQHGPYGPVPATGRRVEIEFHTMIRIAAGRIAEMWVEWDNLNILAQLGHRPDA